MAKIVDGGPAFPVAEVRDSQGNGITEGSPGLTKREWFAGQALMGVVMNIPPGLVNDMADRTKGGAREANAAYAWADAMIARGKK